MGWKLATIWIFSLNLSSLQSHDLATVPLSYDIVLQADLNKMTFNGSATIATSTLEDNNHDIKLSIRGLKITNVKFMMFGKAPLIVNNKINEKHERLELRMDFVPKGNHTIVVQFEGIIDDKPMGFFKSPCYSGGNISWIAGALFEPIHARSVFPVFDLSEARTAVKLTLLLDKNVRIITSKSPVVTNLGNLQQVVVDFGEVLIDKIGWVIYPSDGTIKKIESQGQTVITCGQHTEGISAVSLISRELRNYTGLNLNGIYWVLLPDISIQTASSNKIIFMRDYLMEYSNYSSTTDNYENQMAVTEGYVQQVFGQVIASNSWSDLWITKGLSKFFRYKLMGKINTDFNSESYIAGHVMPRVLERENIPHSMSKHVDSTRDILSVYDEDLFDKAGLIMRMLEDIVGEDNFRRAIVTFASKTTGKEYNGTSLSWYFWNSLFESSDRFPPSKDITAQHEMMRAWIRSDGYPVISAKRTGNSVIITQVKSIAKLKTTPGYWWVPISVTSQSLRQPKKYWLRPNGNLIVSIPQQDKWYMINENGKGLYRVNYDMENWQNLSSAISNGELTGIAKSRIIDDSLGLAEQNIVGYSVALAFTRHLAEEYKDHEPWTAAIRHLLTVKFMLSDSTQQNTWDEYVSLLVKSYVYGVDLTSSNVTDISKLELKDMDTTTFYKLSLIHGLCRDNSYCSDLYSQIPLPVNSSKVMGNFSYGDMLSGILCYNVETNVNSTFWWNYMKNNKDYKTINKTFIGALGCSKDITLLYRYLNETILLKKSQNTMRQSVPWFISEVVYVNDVVRSLSLKIMDNVMTLLQYLVDDPFAINGVIIPISERAYDEDYKNLVPQIFDIMEKSDLMTSSFNEYQYHRAIRRMETNLWRKHKCYGDISNWLEHKDSPNADFVTATASRLDTFTMFSALFIFVSLLRYKFNM